MQTGVKNSFVNGNSVYRQAISAKVSVGAGMLHILMNTGRDTYLYFLYLWKYPAVVQKDGNKLHHVAQQRDIT